MFGLSCLLAFVKPRSVATKRSSIVGRLNRRGAISEDTAIFGEVTMEGSGQLIRTGADIAEHIPEERGAGKWATLEIRVGAESAAANNL